jgi:FkbM family methyltransferase
VQLTMQLENRRGWMTPVEDQVALDIILRESDDIATLINHCKDLRCAIQAGGNIGIWPVKLAQHFQRVITAEPGEANFSALKLNTQAYPTVFAINAAFGQSACRAALEVVQAGNIGAHRITEGDAFEVITIDSLGITDCDLLQLDVEGYELFAIQGALRTIEASSPLICVELKGLGKRYGASDQQLRSYLECKGYKEILRLHRDVVFARR